MSYGAPRAYWLRSEHHAHHHACNHYGNSLDHEPSLPGVAAEDYNGSCISDRLAPVGIPWRWRRVWPEGLPIWPNEGQRWKRLGLPCVVILAHIGKEATARQLVRARAVPPFPVQRLISTMRLQDKHGRSIT